MIFLCIMELAVLLQVDELCLTVGVNNGILQTEDVEVGRTTR